VAQAEAKLVAAARHPDWTWEAAFQQRGPAYSNMVSIGVSIPLPWDAANRQDRETAARRALVDEALARRDEMLRAHISEVGGMLEEWRAGRERQARFHRDIVPLAAQKTSAVLASFSGGRGRLDEVLASRKGEFEVELQSLQLDLDVATLWARLEFLLPDAQAEGSR
jgi:outer membrane protein TolC